MSYVLCRHVGPWTPSLPASSEKGNAIGQIRFSAGWMATYHLLPQAASPLQFFPHHGIANIGLHCKMDMHFHFSESGKGCLPNWSQEQQSNDPTGTQCCYHAIIIVGCHLVTWKVGPPPVTGCTLFAQKCPILPAPTRTPTHSAWRRCRRPFFN